MKRSTSETLFTSAATAQSVVRTTEGACGVAVVFKVVIATSGTVTLNVYVSPDNSNFYLTGTTTITATSNYAFDIQCRKHAYVKIETADVTDAVTSCIINVAAKGTEIPGPFYTVTALSARTTAGNAVYVTDNAVDLQVDWTNTMTGSGTSTVKNIISGSNNGTDYAILDTATVTTTSKRSVNIDLASKPYAYIKIENATVTTATTTAVARITSHTV